MISVLAHKSGKGFPVRGPALGLFLDLEVRLLAGPMFVDERVPAAPRGGRARARAGAPSPTGPRPPSPTPARGTAVATVLLHQGVFKDSYAGYPQDRLT